MPNDIRSELRLNHVWGSYNTRSTRAITCDHTSGGIIKACDTTIRLISIFQYLSLHGIYKGELMH